MRLLDVKYAHVYIDDEGETLTHDDYVTETLITNYYNSPGALQWNHYVIIPKELVKTEDIEKIETSMTYARKFVVDRDKITDFFNDHFPELKEERGKIQLIKGKNWREAGDLAVAAMLDRSNQSLWACEDSFYRNLSMMDTLTELDKLRTALIRNPFYRLIFYTHITQEFNLARQKLEIFL